MFTNGPTEKTSSVLTGNGANDMKSSLLFKTVSVFQQRWKILKAPQDLMIWEKSFPPTLQKRLYNSMIEKANHHYPLPAVEASRQQGVLECWAPVPGL